MTAAYQIAGVKIRVSTIHDGFHVFAGDYRIDGSAWDFEAITGQGDIDSERTKSPGESFPDSYIEALAVFRKISERMPEYDAFLFHGSAISADGLGCVFAAPSGTGKSTHAAMWREMLGGRAVMVNDDKPMIRIWTDGAEIFGSPFSGKHNLGGNIHVPLRAICILRRGATNHIERVSHSEAYPDILRQTYRPASPLMLAKTLTLLDRLKDSVSFYRLTCNMNPDAAKVSWEAMRP
ncbi:MAG: hypothetical protein IJG37_10335 [Synergistaceae bacterium]|nr:hypothetical protein [Synergistaceae bacterium]MBQ6970838.1 hypothetical protein [Synergistaceae bacterium]